MSATSNDDEDVEDRVESYHTAVESVEELKIVKEEEDLNKLIKQFNQYAPKVRLELIGLQTMRLMFGFVWIIGLFTVILGIVISSIFSSAVSPTSGDWSGVYEACFVIEGITRTISVLLLLFLLISFPQRVCVFSKRRSTSLTFFPSIWSQTSLIFLIIILNLCPYGTIYGLVIFWQDYAVRDDTVSQVIFSPIPTPNSLNLLYPFADAMDANYVMVAIQNSYIAFFLFSNFHFFTQDAKSKQMNMEKNEMNDEDDEEDDDVYGDDHIHDDDLENPEESANRTYQAEIAARAKTRFYRIYHGIKDWEIKSMNFIHKYTGNISLPFLLLIIAYLVLLMTSAFTLDTHQSIVPVVEIITILRVCLTNSTFYLGRNTTLIGENGTMMNVQIISSITSNKYSVCSPYQPDDITFKRALVISVICLFEIFIIVYILRASKATKLFLNETAYAKTRSEILGYHFFHNVSRLAWAFLILTGILTTGLNPIDVYMVPNSYIYNASSNAITFYVDPLFQVGLTPGTLGFGPFFLILVFWVLILAYANLPPDSYGLRGWFISITFNEKNNKDDDDVIAALQRTEYLTLVSKEEQVINLLEMKKQASKRQRIPPLWKESLSYLFSTTRSDLLANPLVLQIRSNLFVLETEILLFHFMHLSYILASLKFDLETNERIPLTFEEKQRLVEDTKYSLVEHVIDVITDTHVMIFSSLDRIIIAFRGSVSLTNWQTDFDASEVICPYLENITPDYSDFGIGPHVKRQAEKPPKVHGGFLKAYESVRTQILSIVDFLLKEEPKRVIFVTGHSLGGGLAIVCTCDLAVELNIPPTKISLTTWGTPKVGTFSFITRFHTLCPNAKRFCMTSDIITKLPLDPFLKDITLKGWWHVGTEILLSTTGNMLIRPSPLEKFMFHSTLGKPSAHLRMSYGTCLMLWVIRTDPSYNPDWWVSVITLFHKNAEQRLKTVPLNLKVRLLDSLTKPGISYMFAKKLVRDMVIDTSYASSSKETGMQEPDATELITSLLVAFRIQDEHTFKVKLQEINEAHERFFKSNRNRVSVREVRKDDLNVV